MKRRNLAAAALFATLVVGSAFGVCAEDEFNPDKVEDAMTIEQVRETLGEEVPVADGLSFGCVMKSLSNEFWRTLEEGYQKAEENVKAAGADFSVQQADRRTGRHRGQKRIPD